ncbi:MAG: tRNA 5-methoxyuridine(34)/uridine 5-oxyacetic acid(34) synthase CmoB [Pseudomonadota bacterium]|jgi:tRNA (mo5U34)-methyltransferase
MPYSALYNALCDVDAQKWAQQLPAQIADAFDTKKHGDLLKWQTQLAQLPSVKTNTRTINADTVTIGSATDISNEAQNQLKMQLQAFSPWRKGPYDLFGIFIDTEWRSDWKWQRLEHHITPLHNRLVLDVGCGNGYHCWRMLGAGAKRVIGIDPMLLNVMQFQLIKQFYNNNAPIDVLPLGIEALPQNLRCFDSVFSMGVLYHRRSPIDHLFELRDCLKSGGELILETLVIDGKLGDTLLPEDRYAQMRNVWFLPSCDTLLSWLNRCGFKNTRVVDITKTTTQEQRTTDWMRFHSLKEFLNSENPNLTYEGLPAPKRAIIIANAP